MNKESVDEMEQIQKGLEEFLEKEVPCYDYEVEKFTPFIEKGVTEPQEVYAHLDALPPHHGNAFLFRRYLRRHLPHLPHR